MPIFEPHVHMFSRVTDDYERMAEAGNIAPDLWMQRATGAPVGPEALLEATERALQELQ